MLEEFTKEESAETEASFHSTGVEKEEPKELISGKEKGESLDITLQFYKRSPENVVHSLKVKTLPQLQAFPFLAEEMKIIQKEGMKGECIRYVNVSSLDAGALRVLLEILRCYNYQVPKMPKVTGSSSIEVINERARSFFDLMGSNDLKNLFRAAQHFRMDNLRDMACLVVGCRVWVENKTEDRKAIDSLENFRRQQRNLGVEKEFNYADMQQRRRDNPAIDRILSDNQ